MTTPGFMYSDRVAVRDGSQTHVARTLRAKFFARQLRELVWFHHNKRQILLVFLDAFVF